MWVFAHKFDSDGNIIRHKARLVAKGFQQREGIDYNLTFAPVLKYKSLRIILALTVQLDLELVQMDVVTAFLNADIKEEVYMKQPQGYQQGDNNLRSRLTSSLFDFSISFVGRTSNSANHELAQVARVENAENG
jgi:hypothetical protein